MKTIFLILFFTLSSCNKNSDKLIIGTSADNPPYEYIKDNQIIGIDIDIIKEIAKILNKEIEIRNMEFNMLIPSLASGNVDIVIAGISVTEERRKNFDFSDTYLTSNIAILYIDKNITANSSMKNKILGAQLGSTWSNVAYTLSPRVRELSNNLILLEELKIGNIDAMVIEESQAKIFAEKYSNCNYFSIKQSSDFAIILAKNSPLTSSINNAINQLKNNKFIETIKNEWIKKN